MKKKLKLSRIFVVLFTISLVALFVYIYVVPKVSDTLLETYIAEYNRLDVGIDKTCLFVRDETVVFADMGGSVTRKAAQGELVKKGAAVASIGDKDCVSPRGGVVSYYYDGLESTMTVSAIDSLHETTIKRITEEAKKGSGTDVGMKSTKEGEASMGDALYKIVNQNRWYIIGWLTEEEKIEFSEGADITVRVDTDTEFEASIASIAQDGDIYKVVVAVESYYKDFDSCRVKACRLISYNESGIILENSSITEEGGRKGVYVISTTGGHEFIPVKVKYTFGDKTLVEGSVFYDSEGKRVNTVRNYQRVMRDPSKEIKPDSGGSETG